MEGPGRKIQKSFPLFSSRLLPVASGRFRPLSLTLFSLLPHFLPSLVFFSSFPSSRYDIIVCHGNVIRYFFLRALQLPPEAWLRLCTFNCSLTYFTIRPTGGVSCRTLGDVGHLDMERTTFSGHHGFNW